MSTVRGPLIDGCEAKEEAGAITSAKLVYTVDGISGATGTEKMANALAAVPYVFGSVPAGFPNLIVLDRSVKPVTSGNNTVFTVTCECADIGSVEGAGVFSLRSSLTSHTTYTDVNGVPIVTAYTYPVDYVQPELAGLSVISGNPVTVTIPTIEATVTKIFRISNLSTLYANWPGRLNATPWAAGAVGQWQCTNISDKLVNRATSPYWYLVQFTFVYSSHGWQPRVAFATQQGETPADLTVNSAEPINGTYDPFGALGVGAKKIKWFPYADFHQLFPAPG